MQPMPSPQPSESAARASLRRRLVAGMADRVVARLRLPGARAWRELAAVAALYALVATPVALAAGLLPGDGPAPWWRLALLPVVPALGEELIFRGLLLPRAPRRRIPWRGALLSLGLYVAAHPLLAWWLRPSALETFAAPDFLLLTVLLGAACTALTLRARSLWPAVALHAFVVIAWGVGGGLPSWA